MILRSSLVQRRDDISDAEFSRYFRDIHGPLAAKLPNTRTYKQNHRARRWDLPEATFLPRVAAYTQVWFDDLHTMFDSMGSPEQDRVFEDLKAISHEFVVTVQKPGDILGHRTGDATKLTLIMAGNPTGTPAAQQELLSFVTRYAKGQFALRVNEIFETGDSTPITPELGAFAELWLHNDAVAEELLNRGLLLATGPMQTCWAMQLNEIVLVDGPEI